MTPKTPAQTKSIHLQLPADLLAQIDKICKDSDVPRNAWIRRAIQQRLDRETTPRASAMPTTQRKKNQ